MEAEFASWQAKVGPDFRALESALKPVERWVHCCYEVHSDCCVQFHALLNIECQNNGEYSVLHFFWPPPSLFTATSQNGITVLHSFIRVNIS